MSFHHYPQIFATSADRLCSSPTTSSSSGPTPSPSPGASPSETKSVSPPFPIFPLLTLSPPKTNFIARLIKGLVDHRFTSISPRVDVTSLYNVGLQKRLGAGVLGSDLATSWYKHNQTGKVVAPSGHAARASPPPPSLPSAWLLLTFF